MEWIRNKFRSLSGELSERSRRCWAAVEAASLGHGGVSTVSEATGIARSTIRRDLRDLSGEQTLPEGQQRRSGGGRKRAEEIDTELCLALERLVDPESRGDPESPLRWTCKSTRLLARQLTKQGHPVSSTLVGQLLNEAGYSLQANRRRVKGSVIQIATLSFGISTGEFKNSKGLDNQRSRSTPRRRKRWERRRIQDAPGVASDSR